MMPHQRMSRIPMRRLPEDDERVLVPICQIVHRGKLYGDFRVVGERPRLLYSLDRLEDPVWVFRPHPVACFHETFCDEVPGAAPKPIVPAAFTRFGDSLVQSRGPTAAWCWPFDLLTHPNMTT
jgi:hypothetical protein